MKHIKEIINDDWIEECFIMWGSVVVLYPKTREEMFTDMEDLI